VKNRLFILVLFPMLLISTRAQAEMIQGRVTALEQEEDVVILHIHRDDAAPDEELTIQAAGPLPPCVQKGKVIRAWGDFSQDKKIFTATDVRGPGPRFTADTTGARSRLHHFSSHRGSVARQHQRPYKRHHRSRRRHRR